MTLPSNPTAEPAALPEISRKILFVDDEILLLEGIKRQLRRDFDLTVADGGAAGLRILAEQGPFAVVVSDYNMPDMDGIAFLNAVYRQYPNTVLVMLTGRAELDIAVNALHSAHIARFLNKPCPPEILRETLNDGLEQYRLKMAEQILQNQLQQANHQLGQLNAHLEDLVAKKTRALALQYRYVANMTRLNDSRGVVSALIATLTELIGSNAIGLWLSPGADQQFRCFHPQNGEPNQFAVADLPEGAIRRAIAENRRWQFGSPLDGGGIAWFTGQPLACLPMVSSRGVIGLVTLAGDGPSLTADTLSTLIGMLNVTATALQSHWHREAFIEAQDAIITALAKLSEYRDPETGSHLLRLKKYCELICRHMSRTERYAASVTAEFTQDLVRSSPLHDIGKVGIPDAILKKPGRLTPEEFQIMKTHAAIGGDTLRSVYEQYPSQGFIKCGMDVAYGHHERWDGSGYPLGLRGEDIPLAARILALVDVYDALTSRRVYKAPMPRGEAMNLIVEGNGSHFDPDIVAAFQELEPQFHRIAETYADHVEVLAPDDQ
ncbi:HD domain-containing phosphohydrolase [Methylomonas sp. MED-D]|uniref:HD domain-containing phosphohydrolase n=1 Tax=Methylomonas sp. MED-D TaxID=3418768 RepID=UPI003D06F677